MRKRITWILILLFIIAASLYVMNRYNAEHIAPHGIPQAGHPEVVMITVYHDRDSLPEDKEFIAVKNNTKHKLFVEFYPYTEEETAFIALHPIPNEDFESVSRLLRIIVPKKEIIIDSPQPSEYSNGAFLLIYREMTEKEIEAGQLSRDNHYYQLANWKKIPKSFFFDDTDSNIKELSVESNDLKRQ